MRATIGVVAGAKSSGERVIEEILVEPIAADVYRVAASPGLVDGVARGDTIRYSSEDESFIVLERGGNLAVQVYSDPADLADQLRDPVQDLGGTMDGRADKLTVFSIPIAVGFGSVESLFESFMREHPGAEWWFGNVYDPADGTTPLNWWAQE